MKNVLLTTTALVAFAGAAAADVSWSAGADLGYNDDVKGGYFYDANLDVAASADLGDGYSASISYGFDLETGKTGLQSDAYPTVEIIAPFGSLKGGDLGDKGASEYFYADRDGMALDVENHDSSARFDIRALAEFGDFGVAVGGVDDGAGELDGLNVGAGGTFGNVTVALGYDEEDAGAASAGTYVDSLLATTAVSLDTTFGGATVGLSYITNDAETSTGVAVGFEVSADLSVGVYYANNDAAGDNYGASADYTMDALTVGAYYDHTEATDADAFGIDVSYAVSADVTAYAGYFDADLGADGVSYVGVVYAINDSVSATVSFAEANEISGPEFKNGTTVMLSASF